MVDVRDSDYRGLIEEMEQDRKEKKISKTKAADAEWITDRLPTRDDSDSNDDLWFSVDGRVMSRKFWYHENNDYDAWMPKPKMPEPFLPKVQAIEPDTSLAASIERMWSYAVGGSGAAEYWDSRLYDDDLQRIIDAAQKAAEADNEWTAELIRLCERMTYLRDGADSYWHIAKEIGEHLNKRGER